jgi:hypothetical protein
MPLSRFYKCADCGKSRRNFIIGLFMMGSVFCMGLNTIGLVAIAGHFLYGWTDVRTPLLQIPFLLGMTAYGIFLIWQFDKIFCTCGEEGRIKKSR